MKLLLLLITMTLFGFKAPEAAVAVEATVKVTVLLQDGTTFEDLVSENALLMNEFLPNHININDVVSCTSESANGDDDCRITAATCRESGAGYLACMCAGGYALAC
ncbi:hypothetical protein [Neolewinella antarctica]|uniref:Uncharacterized protein n=1 Tax=Neolewinella antarctica TaxID=442734 RepID=A0ABX0XBU8_9BACT|nr:hypothetical protein [Neolewinella antarctica]NJC26399.1 hypothetical protein [Neolewinella antarctica]